MTGTDLVRSAEDMDEHFFLMHLKKRHPESLIIAGFDKFASEYVEHCYRQFHVQLHKLRLDIPHEHEENP